MLRIPSIARHHVVTACKLEKERIEAIQAALGDNDDWPADYDPNDIPLYAMILDTLEGMIECDGFYEADINGKVLAFVWIAVYEYLSQHAHSIPPIEFESLQWAYANRAN